jgi:hypothetical protein
MSGRRLFGSGATDGEPVDLDRAAARGNAYPDRPLLERRERAEGEELLLLESGRRQAHLLQQRPVPEDLHGAAGWTAGGEKGEPPALDAAVEYVRR